MSGSDPLYDLIGALAEQVTDGVDLPPLPGTVREARTLETMPMEAIRLLSLAVGRQEAGEMDDAIQFLTVGIERYPNVSEFTDLRAELLGA